MVVLLYCQYIALCSCVETEDASDQLKIEISLRSCEQLHTVSACKHYIIVSILTDNRTVGLTLIGFLVAEGASNPFPFVELARCYRTVILAVRTWTLWNRSKRLAIVLGIMCISSGTVAIAIEVIFIKTLSGSYIRLILVAVDRVVLPYSHDRSNAWRVRSNPPRVFNVMTEIRNSCPVFHGTPLIAINFILVILYETGTLYTKEHYVR